MDTFQRFRTERAAFMVVIAFLVGLNMRAPALAAGNTLKSGVPVTTSIATGAATLVAVGSGYGSCYEVCFRNEDAANYVRVGPDNTVTAAANGQLMKAGESWCMYGSVFYSRADTGAVNVTATCIYPG